MASARSSDKRAFDNSDGELARRRCHRSGPVVEILPSAGTSGSTCVKTPDLADDFGRVGSDSSECSSDFLKIGKEETEHLFLFHLETARRHRSRKSRVPQGFNGTALELR